MTFLRFFWVVAHVFPNSGGHWRSSKVLSFDRSDRVWFPSVL